MQIPKLLLALVALPAVHHCLATPVEIVLAHCKEDTTWIKELGYDTVTLSYDKCGDAEGPGKHIARPNVGREGGTYLQHIVERYDTLADWTVFSQAEKPTYGYRGHRLGGGHLMSNVRFQDYVDAAEDRAEQPLFFVFTNALVMTKENLYQCIRERYGEEFAEPPRSSPLLQMCGKVGEWQRWFEFPAWFKEMIHHLLQEQGAPVPTLAPKEILQVFQVDVSYGVTFFAQGARFAASRQAIQSKPKAYYEELLKFMGSPDPWAGYFLEWLWWYVLGGSSGPCGYEEAVLRGYQEWTQHPGRHMTIQAVSGNTTSSTTISGNTSLGSNVTTQSQVVFQPGSVTTTTKDVMIGGSTGATCVATSCTINVGPSVTLTFTIPFIGQSVAVNVPKGSTIIFSAGSDLDDLQVAGDGDLYILGPTNRFSSWRNSKCKNHAHAQNTDHNGRRRTGYATTYSCGNTWANFTVNSGADLEFQDNCTVTGQSYSNYVQELNWVTGALMSFSGISSTALPTMISTWDNPSQMPIAVSTADTTSSFSKTILLYGNNGTCTTSWPTTYDNCPSGMTCSVTGSVYTDPTYCQMVYSQTPNSSGSSNNNGLLGLIALVALVPLLALVALGVWWFAFRQTGAELAPQYYYPDANYGLYPADVPPTPAGGYPANAMDVAYLESPGAPYVAPTPASAYPTAGMETAYYGGSYLAPSAGLGGSYLAPPL